MSEYWIRDGGDVDFADGDIGDYNHEGIVIQQIMSSVVDACTSKFDVIDDRGRPYYDTDMINWDEYEQRLAIAVANELIEKNPKAKEKIEDTLENDPSLFLPYAFKEAGVSQEDLDVLRGRGDARDYAMVHWKWKTYRDGSIDTWNLRKSDLHDILNGVETIADEEGWSDKKLNRASFTITVFATRRQFHVSYRQLVNKVRGSKFVTPGQEQGEETGLRPGDHIELYNQYWTNNARQQIRNIELQDIHPAYKRPGVNPFGDSVLGLPTFSEWLKGS